MLNHGIKAPSNEPEKTLKATKGERVLAILLAENAVIC